MKTVLRTIFVLFCLSGIPGILVVAGANDTQHSTSQLEMLEAQAAAGSDKAQMKLARMYLEGQGTTADIEKSLFYYGLAAERGIAFAHHRLARIYLDGDHVEADPDRGLRWLKSAANLGYVPAQLDLSLLYETGAGIPQDRVESYKWIVIAASLSDLQLDSRREQIEESMTYIELAHGAMLARICMLGGYQDC